MDLCTVFNFDSMSCFWILSSIAILGFHFLLHFENIVAVYFKDLYFYGKVKSSKELSKQSPSGSESTQYTGLTLDSLLTDVCCIPKRYFSHFYGIGIVCHTAVFFLILYPLILTKSSDDRLKQNFLLSILKWPCFSSGTQCSMYPVVTVYLLEGLQIGRRLYECLNISHFSSATMSIVHYFYGIFFYSTFGFGFLSSIQIDKMDFPGNIPENELLLLIIGISMYFVAAYFQHQSMITFASLRSKKKESSSSHYIPRGHLFEWVSCPHYLCEIIIYSSLCIIFGGKNDFLLALTLFVCITQICSGILTHQWYRRTFTSYPPSRTAIIPYLL